MQLQGLPVQEETVRLTAAAVAPLLDELSASAALQGHC